MADKPRLPTAQDSLVQEVAILRRRLAEVENRAGLTAGDRTLRLILESAIDYAIVGMDLDGLVTAWNEGARRVLGWTEEEMIGQPAANFFTSEDRGKGVVQKEMQAALTKERGNDERWHLRKDGSLFWANGEMMPLKDDAGAVHGFVKILRDRTLQRQVAEQQRADGEFVQRVLAASGDCIKVLDLSGNLLFMTEAGMHLMEVSDFNAIRGCPWPDFWKGRLHEQASAAVEAARNGGIGHFIGPADTMAGTRKYWDVQVTPMLDELGQPERLLAVSRDITAIKRAEIRRDYLLELGDRLRSLDNTATMTFTAAEILARELQPSRAGYALIGPRSETIAIERDWTVPGLSSTAGTHAFRPDAACLRILRQEQALIVTGFETDARANPCATALGSISSRSMLIIPVFEYGTLAGLFFASHTEPRVWLPDEIEFAREVADRTRVALGRRRAEQTIQDLAASLERQVADRTRERDQIWRVSRDLLGVSDENGVWLSVNPAWTATLGWDVDEILGRSFEWMIHPDDIPAARRELAHLVAGGSTSQFEVRFQTVDGSYRWLSWTADPADGRIYVVGRDVTAQKHQAETLQSTTEQLRQSQKMEAVGQLTGGLAHDFNNLLTGISGNLELLRVRLQQRQLDDLGRYVHAALDASTRAAGLAHRLLAFSRKQALDPKPVQVNKIVTDIKDLIDRSVGSKVEVVTSMAGDLWMTLCDPNQLENAILNLAINARDAMPDGGRIMIETSNLELVGGDPFTDELKAGPYVMISVTDIGTGMSPEVIAQAFDPFFTTKPPGQGTGLGLSMIYVFAQQSGGQVKIRSKVGQGTSISIYLPRLEGHEGSVRILAPARPLIVAPVAGETILVVDDEPTIRQLVTEVAEDLGYTVIEAADGPSGLALVQSAARIDLVITDFGLPGGVDGRRLANAARETRPHLKVLFITGYAEETVSDAVPLPSEMSVLGKPFTTDVLTARIGAAFSPG